MAKKNEAKNLEGMEDILDEVEKEADSATTKEETEMSTKEDVTESVETVASIDMSEEINALFDGVDLTEDFKTKTKTIFEATVGAKVAEIVAEKVPALVAEETKKIENTYAEHLDTLYTRIDNYMDAITEQWYSENEVAIRSTIRADLAEGFLTGLKGLFESNYITVPEGKEDMLETTLREKAELSELLESTMKTLSEKNDQIDLLYRKDMINEAADGMTALDAEKFRTLAENVEFTDVATYSEKLATIKETFFKDKSKSINEDTTELKLVVEEKKTAPVDEMDYLSQHLSRLSLKN